MFAGQKDVRIQYFGNYLDFLVLKVMKMFDISCSSISKSLFVESMCLICENEKKVDNIGFSVPNLKADSCCDSEVNIKEFDVKSVWED